MDFLCSVNLTRGSYAVISGYLLLQKVYSKWKPRSFVQFLWLNIQTVQSTGTGVKQVCTVFPKHCNDSWVFNIFLCHTQETYGKPVWCLAICLTQGNDPAKKSNLPATANIDRVTRRNCPPRPNCRLGVIASEIENGTCLNNCPGLAWPPPGPVWSRGKSAIWCPCQNTHITSLTGTNLQTKLWCDLLYSWKVCVGRI